MAPVKDKKFYKKYLKALQYSQGFPKQSKELIRAAPVPVLKLLSNAAIIASKGDIKLTPNQKHKFAQHRRLFRLLGSPGISFNNKRKYLIQRGGSVIPILLSTLLPLAGQVLFDIFGKRE